MIILNTVFQLKQLSFIQLYNAIFYSGVDPEYAFLGAYYFKCSKKIDSAKYSRRYNYVLTRASKILNNFVVSEKLIDNIMFVVTYNKTNFNTISLIEGK